MADEMSVAAGKRFSRDLRRIREDRGVSIDEVHQETRIARSLIEAFEEGGLYDHETFNEVYLRSFVQAYAEAVKISPDTVRTELEAALEGSYESALADRYLTDSAPSEGDDEEKEGIDEASATDAASDPDRPPTRDDEAASSEPPVAGGPEGRGGIVGPARALGEEPEADTDPSEESVPVPPEGSDADDASPDEDDASSDDDTELDGDTAASEEHPSPTAEDEPSTASEPSVEDDAESDDSEAADSPEEGAADDSTGLPEDRRPSWMEEGEEGEEAPISPRAHEEEGERPGGDAQTPPTAETGETGIVGEPTAMGSGSGEQPSPSAAPSAPQPPGRGPARRSGWRAWFQGQQREMVWAGVGFVVVLLVLVGLAVAFFSADPEPAPSESTTASTAPASDTAAAPAADTSEATPAEESRPSPANVTLGSSIPLTVLATRDVQGIRIERDDDLARPYWIEEGEAAVFPFENQAILESQLGNVQLFLAGYPYPESQWDTTGGLVITRADVEAFVDTLRGAPAALTTSPDTISKGPPDE